MAEVVDRRAAEAVDRRAAAMAEVVDRRAAATAGVIVADRPLLLGRTKAKPPGILATPQ